MLSLKNERTLWWVLGSILLLRLVGLGIYPLILLKQVGKHWLCMQRILYLFVTLGGDFQVVDV